MSRYQKIGVFLIKVIIFLAFAILLGVVGGIKN